MSLFDFFRKKQKHTNTEKPPEQNITVKEAQKQIKPDSPSFVNITTKITPLVSEDVIPIETRTKDAIASKHGLYPHEVLLLDYAESYSTEGNNFEGFWWHRYGVRDVEKCIHSLIDRGFLQIGDLQHTLEKETTNALKEELRKYGLKVSGKKSELIQRLMEEVPHDELNSHFTKRTYQLTELGKQTLAEEGYVPYIHRHPIEDLDIWSLNKIVHEPPYMPYRDKIWKYLIDRSMKHFQAGDFGLYRNCLLSMYDFLLEEKKLRHALDALLEVVFVDLSGLRNNYTSEHPAFFARRFFPYEDSLAKIPPGIIRSVMYLQKELNLSDDEFRKTMIDQMSIMSLPFHIFTPVECAEIVLMEIKKVVDGLDKIYSDAKQRLKQRFPGIDC